jgi:hypothetical protein
MATRFPDFGKGLSVIAVAAGFGLVPGAPPLFACVTGDAACPVMLKLKPGETEIRASGTVSGEKPDYYFALAATAGQKIIVHTDGGGLKTGPGIPISGPGGMQDAVDEDAPFTLPATGTYVLDFHANTMSDGPFGRFRMSLKIN